MGQAWFGAIADDFTGATDLAAMLGRAGVPVTLRVGVPEAGAEAAPFEVIALKIRTVPAAEAVAQARSALAWLRGAGVARVFWKYCSTFDSTSRGNIGPVAEALMADLGAEATLHCPAFPENGRRVFMGHLFVHDLPLDESPMRDHPLTPMRDADLARLLGAQAERPVAKLTWPELGEAAARLAEARGHVIADAIRDADLEVLARAAAGMRLICGGSALAAPLPGLWRAAGEVGARAGPPPAPAPGRLVLAGSCSAATRGQVSAYLRRARGYRLDPVDLAREGPGAALDWLAAQPREADKILYATAEPAQVRAAQQALGMARAGALVEEALARLARAARAGGTGGTGAIVVAGGESAGAVTAALGVDALRIGAEIAPGVPWCHGEDAHGPFALALKSGNFGGPDFFAEAFERLGR
jgi:uncharacterized protein YgbK (DUF1537 family)